MRPEVIVQTTISRRSTILVAATEIVMNTPPQYKRISQSFTRKAHTAILLPILLFILLCP
jgi:hypothetical protein